MSSYDKKLFHAQDREEKMRRSHNAVAELYRTVVGLQVIPQQRNPEQNTRARAKAIQEKLTRVIDGKSYTGPDQTLQGSTSNAKHEKDQAIARAQDLLQQLNAALQGSRRR